MSEVTKATFDPSQPLTKVLQVRTKIESPTEAQLEKIRPYLLREFTIDDLYIRKMYLANDQHDRSMERFDLGYLTRFAETITGKSVLVGHDYGSAPVGRFFDSGLEKVDGWQWITTWFYMPKSAGNELTRDNIDSGVWSWVSIGARVDYAGLICDICGAPYYPWYGREEDAHCPHIVGRMYDGKQCALTWDSTRSDMTQVEANEGSIVYLGCQYEAAIAKDANKREESRKLKAEALGNHTPLAERQKGDAKMDELQKVQADLAAMTTERDALTAQVSELKAKVAELEPQAAEGKALKGALVDEVKRLADCVGEGAMIATLLRGDETVEVLQKLKGDLDAKWAEKRPNAPVSKGADDNVEKPAEQSPKANVRDYSVI